MTTDSLLIDCDGHILEPPDLWEHYLDPAYRDRTLRIRVAPDDGYEYLEIDSRFTISRIPHGDPRHDVVFATAQDCDIPFAMLRDMEANGQA